MERSYRAMRFVILSHLFEQLEAIGESGEPVLTARSARVPDYAIDALLAFRSDPRLEALRAALTRLDRREFGDCMICRTPISQKLLDEDPARRLCESCEGSVSRH